jgi:hypothetical protein
MAERSGGVRLGLVVYGVVVGTVATAAGAWASSSLAGTARIGAWVLVTGVCAVSLAWFAESVVALLIRCLHYGLGKRNLSR